MLNTILYIAVLIFWIWALYDIITSNKPTDKKVLWAVIVIIFPLLGTLIYYFAGRK